MAEGAKAGGLAMGKDTDYYIVKLTQGEEEVIFRVYDFALVGGLIKTVQNNNIELKDEENTIFITIS